MHNRNRKTAALITRLHTTPLRDEIFLTVHPILTRQVTVRPEMRARLIDALFDSGNTYYAAQLIRLEAAQRPFDFPFAKILAWVERLAHAGNWDDVWICADRLVQNNQPLKRTQIIEWGKRACHFLDADYRSGGCLLLLGKYQPKTKAEVTELAEWASSAAGKASHGATRLYPILLERLTPKPHGRLSATHAQLLAQPMLAAVSELTHTTLDHTLLPEFMLEMAHSRLEERYFWLVVEAFADGVSELERKMRDAEASLKHYALVFALTPRQQPKDATPA
jgi:hypothetical protein